MDLIEAEDIKKRWQEYTEELYKKDLHDPDNHEDVITHPEPDILECEVKWALGIITTNKVTGGGDQNHPQGKEMQNGKVVSEEPLQIAEKRSERQTRKGKEYPFKCRVPKNKKRQESLPW